jgi:hypothetical protein
MENFIIIYAILVALPCGLFAAFAAEAKGYNAFLWFLGGLAFGIIALLGITAHPIRRQRGER